ncbi:MAG: DUF4233 domain-containing protein [Candidatus Nanopelagicales bacterium]
MRTLCASVLAFEAVVLLLAVPVAVQLSDVEGAAAWWLVAPGVLAIVAAGLLRSRVGLVLGSLVQVLAIGLGFVVPVMFFLGAVFACLWVLAIVLGRRAETMQASRGGANRDEGRT